MKLGLKGSAVSTAAIAFSDFACENVTKDSVVFVADVVFYVRNMNNRYMGNTLVVINKTG